MHPTRPKMAPGDVCRHQCYRKCNGLRLRKLRPARRETILRRMLSSLSVDGGRAPPEMKRDGFREVVSKPLTTEKMYWAAEEDSGRSTLGLLAASSSSSSSTPHDRQYRDDIPAASVSHGVISLMGRRREMEDAVTVLPSLFPPELASDLGGPHSFFAVYDGHGGFTVAEKCKERLHSLVAEELEAEIGVSGRIIDGQVDWEKVMVMSYAKMDKEVCEYNAEVCGDEGGCSERAEAAGKTTGSTAVVAVVGAEEIVVANCGDSRAVLCRGGVAIPLSRDHKPDRPDEMERVESAGGSIVNWNGPRVLGVLATSRSIGDQYLRPYVISVPEVTVHRRTPSDEFLILASDGLWDVVPNDMACELVRRRLLSEQRRGTRRVFSEDASSDESCAARAAALLARMAMSQGSGDNISVIVVMLRRQA